MKVSKVITGQSREGTPRKIGWSCAACFPNPLPCLWPAQKTHKKTRVQKVHPIYDREGWKTIPFGASRTYIAHISDNPSRKPVTIHWTLARLGLFRPIAWRINAKPKRTRIAFDTQVKTALLGTNHSIVLFLIKKELKYRKLYTVDCKVSNGLFPLDLRCIPSKKVILSIHGWLAIAFACRWRFFYSFANNLCSPEGFPHLLSALKSTLLKGFRVWQTWSAGLPKS